MRTAVSHCMEQCMFAVLHGLLLCLEDGNYGKDGNYMALRCRERSKLLKEHETIIHAKLQNLLFRNASGDPHSSHNSHNSHFCNLQETLNTTAGSIPTFSLFNFFNNVLILTKSSKKNMFFIF